MSETTHNDHNTDALDESLLLTKLSELPAPALPAGSSERLHKRARAAFLRASERAKHPFWDLVVRVYGRFEPVMAVTVASAYLMWAFTSAMALYQW